MITERPTIMGLTVYRPWSELIADGTKPVENRDWAPYPWMLGRYIAVHGSTRWDQEGADFIERGRGRFGVTAPRLESCKVGIIAVAKLVGWVEDTPPTGVKVVKMLPGYGYDERDHRWFFGRFGWLLREVRRIAPIEIRGRQKLWALPPAVYDMVRSRYRRAEDRAAADVTRALQFGRHA